MLSIIDFVDFVDVADVVADVGDVGDVAFGPDMHKDDCYNDNHYYYY